MPYVPAYFTSLTLRDVRCFGGEQTLDLHDAQGRPAKWTFILGENGVGKTTLLQCLDAMSSPPGERLRPDALDLTRIGCRSHEARPHIIAGRTFEQLNADPALAREDGGHHDEDVPGMHCCGYGAARRPGAPRLSVGDASDASATLYNDNATLLDVEEWLLQRDYAAKSNKDLRGDFERVRQILLDLLPDIDDIRIVGFDRNPPAPAVEMHSPFGWIRPRQMSLGYKSMMAWIVDLAGRMFAAFPTSPDPLREASVVLIDEIDLHLHPRWQRDLIGYLDRHFPNVQFIASAHSPLVVQAAQDANIVVLRRDGDSVVIENDPQSVQGWRIDQILTSDLFGLPSARPPHIEPLLAERRRLLAQPSLSAEQRARVAELEAAIGPLPHGETAEDVDAMESIRRFAAGLRGPDGARP